MKISHTEFDYILEGLARLLEEKHIIKESRKDIENLWEALSEMNYLNVEFDITVED